MFTPERYVTGPGHSLRRAGFNEAGVVHAGEAPSNRSPTDPWLSFNEAGVVHAGEDHCPPRLKPCLVSLQRGRRCSRRRGTCWRGSIRWLVGFNEAGVVHAGEATAASSTVFGCVVLQRGRRCSRRRGRTNDEIKRSCSVASTRPALFTPERGQDAGRARCHRSGFNEAGVVHAGEAARPREAGLTYLELQRGRRCSRRRGARRVRSARSSGRFNEAGVVHAGEGRRLRRLGERARGFNEAGVVHAGEDTHGQEKHRLCFRLQRGRRCSRRRGARAVHQ